MTEESTKGGMSLMKVEIEVPEYSRQRGIRFIWEPYFMIEVQLLGEALKIKANKPGLISLARILLTLAQDEVPMGRYIHLDELDSLEDGSCDLIIEKMEGVST